MTGVCPTCGHEWQLHMNLVGCCAIVNPYAGVPTRCYCETMPSIAAAVTITGHETPAVIARRVHRARTDPRSIAAELVRRRMRKAHLKAMMVQVTCPYCGEVVRNPKGEPTWFEDEIKEVIRCAGPYGCQHEMVIPKAAKR